MRFQGLLRLNVQTLAVYHVYNHLCCIKKLVILELNVINYMVIWYSMCTTHLAVLKGRLPMYCDVAPVIY